MDELPEFDSDELLSLYEDSGSPIELLSDQRYIDETFLDKGAIKSVYKVYDSHCSRSVALARIKYPSATLEQNLDFIREVQITASLEHPNIIRIYNIGIEAGSPWFTMELTSGKTINDKLAENPLLTLTERLSIFSQICSAVAYAHSVDILHLDLKPNNIALGQRDQILVCDWGLASSISTKFDADVLKARSSDEFIKGTLGFMPPEQTQGDFKKEKSADIFGLGALLYYLLTGQAPIPGKTPEETLANTQQGRFNRFRRRTIPERLVPVLQKALAIDPSLRYQDANQLHQEIQQYLEGFATIAEEANFITLSRLFYGRHKHLCNVVTTFLVLIIATSLYYVHSLKGSEQQAISAKEEAIRAKEEALLAEGNARKAETAAILAEQETHRALDEAIESKRIADLNLEKALEATKAKKKADLSLSNLQVKINQLNLNQLKNKEALRLAKSAAAASPNNPAAHLQLGFTHFISQNFKDASESFSNAYKLTKGRQKTASKFSDLASLAYSYQNHKKPLAPEELIKLLNKISQKRIHLQRYMLHYDGTVNPPEDHAKVVHAMLEKINNKKLKFRYSKEQKRLYLNGNGDVAIRMLKNTKHLDTPLFELLPIDILSIDDTPNNRRYILKIPRELIPAIELFPPPQKDE
jgi:tRNA A-37 threonylcarbamoyl transferase component Bud32/tetratricopeptide (TPR) repeat protein